MKTPRRSSLGFTLLETLLAMFVFAVAALSLVECINTIGLASAETRVETKVQSRLESLMTDVSRRCPWLAQSRLTSSAWQEELAEEGIVYRLKAVPLELKTDEGADIDDVYAVEVHAEWLEDGRTHETSMATWVWPYLYNNEP